MTVCSWANQCTGSCEVQSCCKGVLCTNLEASPRRHDQTRLDDTSAELDTAPSTVQAATDNAPSTTQTASGGCAMLPWGEVAAGGGAAPPLELDGALSCVGVGAGGRTHVGAGICAVTTLEALRWTAELSREVSFLKGTRDGLMCGDVGLDGGDSFPSLSEALPLPEALPLIEGP